MSLFVAWTDALLSEDPVGPWSRVRVVAPGLLLIDSDRTQSVVYHELKWQLPDGSAVLVTEAAQPPKFRGLRPGALTFVRGTRI